MIKPVIMQYTIVESTPQKATWMGSCIYELPT